MNILNKSIGRFPLGIWIAIVALRTLFLGWGMQAYSLLDWDGAERAWAQESWGVAAVDMLWPLPIGIAALIGLLRKKIFGFAAGLMEFSIGVYFPLVFAFQRWTTNPETVIVAIFLWMIPSLLGIIGLWANREYFEK